jgi:hypothetical protein
MADKNYIRNIAEKIRKQVDQSALPDKGLDDLFDSYAVLALAKGKNVTNEDVHDAWSAWASKYDPTSDALIPYADLPADKQNDDTRFTDAIKHIADEVTE